MFRHGYLALVNRDLSDTCGRRKDDHQRSVLARRDYHKIGKNALW